MHRLLVEGRYTFAMFLPDRMMGEEQLMGYGQEFADIVLRNFRETKRSGFLHLSKDGETIGFRKSKSGKIRKV